MADVDLEIVIAALRDMWPEAELRVGGYRLRMDIEVSDLAMDVETELVRVDPSGGQRDG